MIFSLKGKRVWVAGHRGMAGSAIVRRLGVEDCEIVTVGREEADLRRQEHVEQWMDVSRLRSLGWIARTPLDEGLRKAYDRYVRNAAAARLRQ